MERTWYFVLCACIWATATASDPIKAWIKVRKFSLRTDTGENVLNRENKRQQRRDLSSIDDLTLEFDVDDKHFKFNFKRSHPIFAHDTTVKITGLVRKNNDALTHSV